MRSDTRPRRRWPTWPTTTNRSHSCRAREVSPEPPARRCRCSRRSRGSEHVSNLLVASCRGWMYGRRSIGDEQRLGLCRRSLPRTQQQRWRMRLPACRRRPRRKRQTRGRRTSRRGPGPRLRRRVPDPAARGAGASRRCRLGEGSRSGRRSWEPAGEHPAARHLATRSAPGTDVAEGAPKGPLHTCLGWFRVSARWSPSRARWRSGPETGRLCRQ